MTEKIVKGAEFREGIKRGINQVGDVVRDTLGPKGNTVIIRDAFGQLTVTKDGFNIAEQIDLKDPVEAMGAELVKSVCRKANNLAGDGTTTANVLAQAIYNEGDKQISLGRNPLEFKQGLNIAMVDLLKTVKKEVIPVTTESPELKAIAMVSSNGDEAVSETITNIYRDLGVHAVLHVTQGNGMETTANVVKGMQFDRGYLSPYCITDKIKMKAEFDNPFIFIYDGKIGDFKTLMPALEHAGQAGKPIIILAENVHEGALRGLAMNHMKGNCQSAIVMSPGYGKKKNERLQDMAVLFGGVVFDENSDMSAFDPKFLGVMDKAEITATDTAFIGGHGTQEEVDERVDFIKKGLEHFLGNKYETDALEERLGKLTGGVAIIKVGAPSMEEGKELLDRVEDCKNAVRAALAEGVIEGGGLALYNASKVLADKTFKKEVPLSVIAGYNALLEAVKAPFNQILINAGKNPELIQHVLTNSTWTGFDTHRDIYVTSMVAANIPDPFKVTRIALESAVSIIGTLLTSNYGVVNADDSTTANFR
jgi:chaperonin GroEL